uniref:Chromo domain-containing protein n=1 Tax=Salvator merianae TaxID=96440 RepID=A0A8D0C342_SALMN
CELSEYEVAQILDSRQYRGRLQYLMDWKGYGPEERSWENAADVHAPDLVHHFHNQYPAKPGPPREVGGDCGEGSGVMPRQSSRLQGILPPEPESSEGEDEPPPEFEASEREDEGVNEAAVSADAAENAENAVTESDLDMDSRPPPHVWFRAEKERERRQTRLHLHC